MDVANFDHACVPSLFRWRIVVTAASNRVYAGIRKVNKSAKRHARPVVSQRTAESNVILADLGFGLWGRVTAAVQKLP